MTRPVSPRRLSAVPTAAGVLAVEAALLLAVSIWYGVRGLLGHPGDRPTALGGAAMGVAAALLLAVLARALVRRRRAALSPVVATRRLARPVGWSLGSAGQYAAGGAVLGLAGATLGLLAGSAEVRAGFRH